MVAIVTDNSRNWNIERWKWYANIFRMFAVDSHLYSFFTKVYKADYDAI